MILAEIRIGPDEHPVIIKGEILFKDDLPGRGLNNYIVLTEPDKRLISIHKNQIINYKELVEYYDKLRKTKI